jgi:hypothetical protein
LRKAEPGQALFKIKGDEAFVFDDEHAAMERRPLSQESQPDRRVLKSF